MQPLFGIDSIQLSSTYRRFAREIGANAWTLQSQKLEAEIAGNAALEHLLRSQFSAVFALSKLEQAYTKHGHIPREMLQDHEFFPALSFAAQTRRLLHQLPTSDADSFRRRVRASFKNEKDYRALRLELLVATHFAQKGAAIELPETTGAGTFDLLVKPPGLPSVEVECKSLAEDFGRQISRRRACDVFGRILDAANHRVGTIDGGSAVLWRVPHRIPSSPGQIASAAKELVDFIASGEPERVGGYGTYSANTFTVDAALHARLKEPELADAEANRLLGVENLERLVVGGPRGVLMVGIVSDRQDTVLTSIHQVMKRAAASQLTGERPGIVVASLEGVTGQELSLLAEEEVDAFQIAATRLLSSPRRQHLVGASYLSQEELYRRAPSDDVGGSSASYWFPNDHSPMWDEGFREFLQ